MVTIKPNSRNRKVNLVNGLKIFLLVLIGVRCMMNFNFRPPQQQYLHFFLQRSQYQNFVLQRCSKDQMDALYSLFDFQQAWTYPVSQYTRCPDDSSWLAPYLLKLRDDSRSLVGINVGCNKGMDAVSMARLLSKNSSISVDSWKQEMNFSLDPACQTGHDEVSIRNSDGASPSPANAIVHCIEPMVTNTGPLKDALSKTQYHASIAISEVAISNTTGSVYFPVLKSGDEVGSIGTCAGFDDSNANNSAAPDEPNCVKVPMYTLDDYLEKESLLDHPIDVLLVDSEGFDFEVLQGAKTTLQNTRFLSFEVHGVHNWATHTVKETVHEVLKDFTCYWEGNNKLWRITKCTNLALDTLYEYKDWSNIACVNNKEVELTKTMEEVFENTLQIA